MPVTSQLNPAAFATPSVARATANGQPPTFATPSAGSSETPQNGQSPAFVGMISGLAGQDQATLGYSATSGNSVGAAPTAANIALLGSYMASSFVSSSDGNGGTLISEAAQISSQASLLAQPHAAV